MLETLSGRTADLVVALWGLVEAGRLSVADFEELAAEIIATARQRGATAAQTVFRAMTEAHTGTPAVVRPTTNVDDVSRLRIALATIVASELDTVMQLTRIAANEPTQAATDAMADEIARSEIVTGWRRGLDSDPCQLCVWWAREGRVWRPEHTMPRHTGCNCHQIPVMKERTTNYQTERQHDWAIQSRIVRNR